MLCFFISVLLQFELSKVYQCQFDVAAQMLGKCPLEQKHFISI